MTGLLDVVAEKATAIKSTGRLFTIADIAAGTRVAGPGSRRASFKHDARPEIEE